MRECTEKALEVVTPIFQKVQQDLSNLVAAQVNPHTDSKYVSLVQWINEIHKACRKHGLAVSQSIDFAQRGEGMPGVEVVTYLDYGGQSIAYGPKFVPLSEKADKSNRPQKVAGASTYARRYALTEIFFLAAESDDRDASDDSEDPVTPKQPPKAPAKWEGKLSRMSHSQRVLMAEELRVLATRFDPELGKAVSPDKWTESNSFGGLRSALATVSRAIEMPVNELIEQIEKE